MSRTSGREQGRRRPGRQADPEPGPHQPGQRDVDEPEWLPVTLTVVRDRSPAGWALLQREDVVADLRSRRVVCAVHDMVDRAQPDLLVARLAVGPTGSIAVLGPRGSLKTGPRVEEVVSELAHEWRTTIVVDDQVTVGPHGAPVPEQPTEPYQPAPDARHAYAFPDENLTVARAMAMHVKERLTAYHADDWVVLASDYAPRMRITGPLARFGARYPFVAMRRAGAERQLIYLAGKGEDALRLDLAWVPSLTPEVGSADPQVRDLARWLGHPRLRGELVVDHPDVSAAQVQDMAAALDGDGAQFLARMGELLGVPPLVAQLAETRPDDPDPGEVRERIQPPGRAALLRQAMADAAGQEQDDYSAGPIGRAQRWLHGRPRLMTGLAALELVAGLVLVVCLVVGWPGRGPWWVTVLLVLVAVALLIDGGIRAVVASSLRSRRPPDAES